MELSTPVRRPVRPRMVHQTPAYHQMTNGGNEQSAAVGTAVIARARLQPLSSTSSGIATGQRQSTTTAYGKRLPYAQVSTATSNGAPTDQPLPSVTSGLPLHKPKPASVPSTSATSPSLMVRLWPPHSAVASTDQTQATIFKKKRWSSSNAMKLRTTTQRPILPKTAAAPLALPANNNKKYSLGARAEMSQKRPSAGNSNSSITSAHWPGLSLSSRPETIYLVREPDGILNADGSSIRAAGAGSVPRALTATPTFPRREFLHPLVVASAVTSASGRDVGGQVRGESEWALTLRGAFSYGNKLERLMKEAKTVMSRRCAAQGGEASANCFTKEMIVIEALEALIAKLAADEQHALAKNAVKAPLDPVDLAHRDLLEVKAAEKDANIFMTSPTDVTFLLNRVAEHHRAFACQEAEWSVVAMERRGHCMELTLDCLHHKRDGHKRIKWSSSVHYILNANHTGRSIANDRIATALKDSNINQRAYLKLCKLAGIGHLSEGYLELCQENPDQLAKRKQELKERLDAAVAKRNAGGASASDSPETSAAKRFSATTAFGSASTAAIEVVCAGADNLFAKDVNAECPEEQPEAGLSPIGEPPDDNWSCRSSSCSVPDEFIENLSMEFSDTQECPICRQLVDDVDFTRHVEKCRRESSRKRLAITYEAVAEKKMRSEFDRDHDSDGKPLI
uniref:UBZ4-type domain-containing protein n=1 Tax=Plectus sambesii TaxID=2011161 RepID=A0A914X4Y3_9BILA